MNKNLGYWLPTGLFCAIFVMGGIGHLFRLEPQLEGMQTLGYPLYVMTILGVAKLFGVAALLIPGQPLLKEWAYAGFTFDLLGASASHAFSGDSLPAVLIPLVVLGLGAVSYRMRPPSRRLAGTRATGAKLAG